MSLIRRSFRNWCKISQCNLTWRLHIETVTPEAFRTFIILYSLFKSDRLSTNSEVIHHKALIRPVMNCACLAWEFAADTRQTKLQRLQNKVIHIVGKFPRSVPIHDMHMAFPFPYVYDLPPLWTSSQSSLLQIRRPGFDSRHYQKKK
jgi:hypothetical protein